MILDRILADTRRALPERLARVPREALERACAELPAPLDMPAALRAPRRGG